MKTTKSESKESKTSKENVSHKNDVKKSYPTKTKPEPSSSNVKSVNNVCDVVSTIANKSNLRTVTTTKKLVTPRTNIKPNKSNLVTPRTTIKPNKSNLVSPRTTIKPNNTTLKCKTNRNSIVNKDASTPRTLKNSVEKAKKKNNVKPLWMRTHYGVPIPEKMRVVLSNKTKEEQIKLDEMY